MLKKMSFAVLSMMVLAGCQEPPQQQITAPLAVSSLTVEQSVTSQYRTFKGQVEAAENTPLAFRVEGELQRVLVKSGQQVKKGDLLAELDATSSSSSVMTRRCSTCWQLSSCSVAVSCLSAR